jgi:hypothetical protein
MATATADRRSDFRAGELFLADSRLLLIVLNQLRHLALRRAFGVSREQANLLTFVIALGVTEASVETARRVVRAPFPLTRGDAIFGGLLMREAGFSLAGPAARAVPGFGALVAVAMVGGVAVPGLRRAIRGARSAEHRIRQQRLAMYNAARTAAEQVRGAVGAEG